MERYSILDPIIGHSQTTAMESASHPAASPAMAPVPDNPKARTAQAERDLDATLQLLAERARYITEASGAAIALRDGEEMVCRASAGETVPPVGARLQFGSGISGEAVRRRQTLRCDQASTDPRVNRESCQALGIESILVMPLLRGEEAIGIFELFSSQAHSFSQREVDTLERMGEMIQTALTQAAPESEAEAEENTAAEVAATEHESPPAAPIASACEDRLSASEPPATEAEALASPDHEPAPVAAVPAVTGRPAKEKAPAHDVASIGKCSRCGFPVSGGRTLCLDCESKKTTALPPAFVPTGPAQKDPAPARNTALPAFLSKLSEEESLPRSSGVGSWIRSHKYMVATIAVVVVIVVVLVRVL
jgi:putative methionine-R-sulfoxide reductase with GAF domain